MATAEREKRGWVRPLRLWCGLVLLAYITAHFANHAVGLVSLAAMEKVRIWFLALWRNPLGETALFGALLVHWGLGLAVVYRRRTIRMPRWEMMQIAFGLAVPPLLVYHLAGTRIANALYGNEDLYARVLLSVWVQDPWAGARQTALFCVAWIHGCIGLHFWLRVRPWYPSAFPLVLTSMVLVPVLAFLGVAVAGREVAVLAQDPAYVPRLLAETNALDEAERASLVQIRDTLFWTTWALLAFTLAARFVRETAERRSTIRVRYFDGREVQVPIGWTVLEASRSAGIPHASVCGGRARCSTCRIRVAGDPALLPKPSAAERRVLARVAAPPNVRLACQLRPTEDVLVTPLFRSHGGMPHAASTQRERSGHEREIAVLFADLRGFTSLAEKRLPYDVVFILNRYFEAVGVAVAEAGGIANQYTGDGVMALFGVETDAQTACRQALAAAGAMVERVAALGHALAGEIETPFKLGLGIHVGPVVVGEMGYGETRYLTAVGDSVNTAARLEQATKEFDCELVVSERVLERAGLDASRYPHEELTLRNREATIGVRLVAETSQLAREIAELSSRSPERGDPASAAAPATPAAPPPRA